MATILDGSYFRTSQGFPGGTVVKNLPANAGEVGLIPGLGRAPGEKGMDPHSSILAWKIPQTKEPGRLQSMSHKELDTTVTEQQESPIGL